MCDPRSSRTVPRAWASSIFVTLLITGVSTVPLPSSAGETGATLIGHVVFRGRVPPPEVVTITRDPDTCGATRTIQPLAVQSRTNGVLNAVVSLGGDSFPPQTDPSAASAIVNDRCAFDPHVQTIRVGHFLEIGNRDPVMHNTHIRIEKRTFFNVAMVAGGNPIRKVVKQPGVLNIRCDVHRFMQGYVVAFDHPYYTVTQANGDFRIVNVPAGRHQVTVWHETLGTLQREVIAPTQGDVALTLEFP